MLRIARLVELPGLHKLQVPESELKMEPEETGLTRWRTEVCDSLSTSSKTRGVVDILVWTDMVVLISGCVGFYIRGAIPLLGLSASRCLLDRMQSY